MKIKQYLPVLFVLLFSSMTASVMAATFWQDVFSGTAGEQVTNWADEDQNSAFNLHISYSDTESWAAVTRTAESAWGKVLSPNQTVDVDIYPMVEIVVTGISASTGWRLGIQEQEGSYTHWDVSGAQSGMGTFQYDFASVTGWSGTHTFSVEIIVEGNPGTYIEADLVRIYNNAGTSTFTPTVSPTNTPGGSGEITFWQDHFVGTAGEQVTNWADEDQNSAFNLHISYSDTESWAAVTRTAESAWGKVLSPNQTVDVDIYPMVEIVVTGISASTGWRLGIQEQEGSYTHWDVSGAQSGMGTFQYDFASVTGWSGTHTFSVEIIVEGNPGTYIETDSVRIYGTSSGTPTDTPTLTMTITPSPVFSPTLTGTPSMTATISPTLDPGASPTHTPTPSPTATATEIAGEFNLWLDHFTGGTAGNQVANWEDETNNSAHNAEIAYSDNTTWAAVTRTADATGWGKVLSPNQSVDVDLYPMVEIVVTGISASTSWRLGIQEQEGSYTHTDLSGSQTGTGTFQYDYAVATGWAGSHTFSVEIIVEGNGGTYIEVDSVRVYGTTPPPSPTVTQTPDLINTATMTSTITPTATMQVTTVAWEDHFESGVSDQQPPDWLDESDDSGFNAEIFYSSTPSWVAVTRTADDMWGKVVRMQNLDVTRYPMLEISVTGVSSGANWKVRIREGSDYYDLATGTNATGVFSHDYAAATAWSGDHAFQVVLVVEGSPSEYIEVDYIRIYGFDMHYTPTPSPTYTPTPTNTPFVDAEDFKAYPNPARDLVTFGFVAAGSVKATIDIYRTTGERVAHIAEDKVGAPGQVLEIAWNAVNVAPGIYFCRMVVVDSRGVKVINEVKKVAIIK